MNPIRPFLCEFISLLLWWVTEGVGGLFCIFWQTVNKNTQLKKKICSLPELAIWAGLISIRHATFFPPSPTPFSFVFSLLLLIFPLMFFVPVCDFCSSLPFLTVCWNSVLSNIHLKIFFCAKICVTTLAFICVNRTYWTLKTIFRFNTRFYKCSNQMRIKRDNHFASMESLTGKIAK